MAIFQNVSVPISIMSHRFDLFSWLRVQGSRLWQATELRSYAGLQAKPPYSFWRFPLPMWLAYRVLYISHLVVERSRTQVFQVMS